MTAKIFHRVLSLPHDAIILGLAEWLTEHGYVFEYIQSSLIITFTYSIIFISYSGDLLWIIIRANPNDYSNSREDCHIPLNDPQCFEKLEKLLKCQQRRSS